MNEFARFIIVGMLNTVSGYLLIFGFMYLLLWSPEASNVAGYSICLIISYLLHRNYTFRSKNRKQAEFGRFLLVFGIAFATNYITLNLTIYYFGLDPYWSQILAGGIYVITSYLLDKALVFNQFQSTSSGK